MKILIATHNQAKLDRYKNILSVVDDIDVVSLSDLNITEKVEENYTTNTENAMHKAHVYGDMSGLITIGVDEAVMTNFLPDNEQPGVYARRFSKDRKEVKDSEYNNIWIEIFKKYPQKDKKFFWSFAVACYNPVNKSETVTCVEPTYYVSGYFSKNYPAGYPMSAIMAAEPKGKPFSDMTEQEKHEVDSKNFKPFIKSFVEWLDQQK